MEKIYIKLRVNPTNHLEEQINDLLNKNYFPRYKFQLSYLAKFSKIVSGEEIVFHKWVKSDFNYKSHADCLRHKPKYSQHINEENR